MSQATFDGVYRVIVQNLSLYRVHAFDDYPHLNHAIFTRKGGVSRAPFHSLNLSTAVGDRPQAVSSNIQQACRAVNTTPKQTVSCHLIHGADVLTINKANQRQVVGQADGLITGDPDIYLFMRFGDCVPLIFYDPVQNAVGLTHAGWRGTMQNAAGATIRAMVDQMGCRPKNIIAVIGPAIGPCCYEVGPEVIGAATATFTDSDSLFTSRNGNKEQANFDLWEANRRQLAAAGVKQIIQSGICTACQTDDFFSHRAENGRTGRFGVIIGLRGDGA
jgi:YfiH family protein